MVLFQSISLPWMRNCFKYLIRINIVIFSILALYWKSKQILFPRDSRAYAAKDDGNFTHISAISFSRQISTLPEHLAPKTMGIPTAGQNPIRENFSGAPLSNQIQGQGTNSSFRWRKIFYDAFNVPDPLSLRSGPTNLTFKDKYFIYRCDNDTMQSCGGFADRFRGMMTAYLIANLTGRVFKSEMIMSDCDFGKLIIPNRVNWTLPVSFHRRVENNDKVSLVDMWSNHSDYKRLRYINWLHHWSLASDFVYMKSFHDFAELFRDSKYYGNTFHWMQGQIKAKLNRFLFQQLFRPSKYLQEKVVRFLTEHVGIEDKLICAHLRMGRNPTIVLETRRSYKTTDLPLVWNIFREFMAQNENKTKIFIMSDSGDALALAKNQDFKGSVFVSSGDIIHIELSQNTTAGDKCEGFEKVIFEFFVLLHCDSLVISDSGLSRMAAYLRNRDDNLYCFLRDGRLIPCKRTDFKIFQLPKNPKRQ